GTMYSRSTNSPRPRVCRTRQMPAADNQGRVLITKDGDYGRLHVQAGIPRNGVVFLKPDVDTPDLADRLSEIVGRHEQALPPGAFVAAARKRARRRAPPP